MPILPIVFSRYYFLNSKEKRFDNGDKIPQKLQLYFNKC